MARIYDSQEIDEGARFHAPPRPTLRAVGALAGSVGIGLVAIGAEATTGAYNYAREHRWRERFVKGIRGLGNQALSALGPLPGPEDGICLTDSPTSIGYVVGSSVVSRVHEQQMPPVNPVQTGRA